MSVLRFPFSQCRRQQTENSQFLSETAQHTLDPSCSWLENTLRFVLVALYPCIWLCATPTCQSGRLTALQLTGGLAVHRLSISPHAALGWVRLGQRDSMVPVHR